MLYDINKRKTFKVVLPWFHSNKEFLLSLPEDPLLTEATVLTSASTAIHLYLFAICAFVTLVNAEVCKRQGKLGFS